MNSTDRTDAGRDPLTVEQLVSRLSAGRPLPTDPTPLAVERLLDAHARRTQPDEIDASMSDPIRAHTPRMAPGYKVNRVLSILDELENSNRRFDA